MSINQSINQYYCDNFHVQNLFPEYLYLVGEIFTSRSPSDPDVDTSVLGMLVKMSFIQIFKIWFWMLKFVPIVF